MQTGLAKHTFKAQHGDVMTAPDVSRGFASAGKIVGKKAGHGSEVGIPESMTMLDDAGLPKSASDDTQSDSQMDGGAYAAGPPRFGRLAMCVAAVSALTIGVMGTVAYGVWFNHDQQTYAAAIVGARQALGNTASATAGAKAATAYGASAAAPAVTAALARSPAPAPAATGATPSAAPAMDAEPGGPLASWSGQVKGHSAQTTPTSATASTTQVATVTHVAPAAPAAPASSSASTRSAANAGTPPAQQVASARPGKEGRAPPQERRATSTNARHKDPSLFARVGQFLRRVSYRQHGNPSRQDNYAHP